MSADESHSSKIKAGMELSRQHKAGEHVEFHKECARCKAEAKERGKRPAYPAAAPTRPDTTGDVPFGTFSSEGGTIDLPAPPSVTVGTPVTVMTLPEPATGQNDAAVPPGKTPEEKEREHQAALKATAEVEKEARMTIPPVFGGPGKRGGDADGELVFHVLADGFTVLGSVWYRGQEIGIRSGSTYDQLSTDTTGTRWYEMSDETQMNRFGQIMFGRGPWPYSAPADASGDEAYIKALNSSDPGAMREYEKQRQRETMPPAPVVKS